MIHETIELVVPGADGGAPLTAYVPDNFPALGMDRRRPALIICPGGGYEHISDREAEPVALRFAGLGYAAFVLRYHVAPQGRWPVPQRQLLAAIDHVRVHCERYHVDPEKVIVLGFSAGGHLAGCAGTMWNKPEVYRALKKKSPAYRPDGMVLCYPVITSGPYGHRESFLNLLGERCDELADTVSLEKRVTRKTPPAFLWHTADDTLVPVENSLLMVKALEAREVPCELHIYPHGRHGQSLADHTVYAEADMHRLSVSCGVWVERCDAWLRRRFLQKQEVPVNE
ncbi:MAG: alpha/beta hydrolase [Oscillospiraceae bacterium]|nr:alpha/beta hydrolase [Oscillospiraceae bacterium]